MGDIAGNWTRTAPVLHPDAPSGTLEVTLTKPTHTKQYVNLHPRGGHQGYTLTGGGFPDPNAGELQPGPCPDPTDNGLDAELWVAQIQRGDTLCVEATVKFPDVSEFPDGSGNRATTTVYFEWIDPSYQPAAVRLATDKENPGVLCDFGRKDRYGEPPGTPTDCGSAWQPLPETCDARVPETGGPIPPPGPACDNRGAVPDWIGVNSLTLDSAYVAANCTGTTCTVHTWVSLDKLGGDNFRFRVVCDCLRAGVTKTVRSEWSASPVTIWRIASVRPDWESNDEFQSEGQVAEIAWDKSQGTHQKMTGEGFFELVEGIDAKMEWPKIMVPMGGSPPVFERPDTDGCDYVAPNFGYVAHSTDWDFNLGFHTGIPYLPPHKFHEINFKERLTGDIVTPAYACHVDLHWQAGTDRINLDLSKDYLWAITTGHELGHILFGAAGHPSEDCESKPEILKSTMILNCMGQANGEAIYHFSAGEIIGKLRTQPQKE